MLRQRIARQVGEALTCIMSAASAGVATPPAAKFTTGSFPFAATHLMHERG
jgi:hypothetical protein